MSDFKSLRKRSFENAEIPYGVNAVANVAWDEETGCVRLTKRESNQTTMNDKEFQLRLNALSLANTEYKKLLRECEDEIERRYGIDPSSCDNDLWIDTFHTGTGTMTVEEVEESMERYSNQKP